MCWVHTSLYFLGWIRKPETEVAISQLQCLKITEWIRHSTLLMSTFLYQQLHLKHRGGIKQIGFDGPWSQATLFQIPWSPLKQGGRSRRPEAHPSLLIQNLGWLMQCSGCRFTLPLHTLGWVGDLWIIWCHLFWDFYSEANKICDKLEWVLFA